MSNFTLSPIENMILRQAQAGNAFEYLNVLDPVKFCRAVRSIDDEAQVMLTGDSPRILWSNGRVTPLNMAPGGDVVCAGRPS